MSVLTLPHRPLAEVFEALAGLVETARKAHRVSGQYARLNALSDRQLADLGLRREDLPKMLFDHHFG